MKRMLATFLSVLAITQLAPAQEPIRERIEWADIWVSDADKDDLPRVLLIGDSITRGYFSEVEKRLTGKAYCARLTTSKCVSDPSFPDEVQLLLKQYRFAAIHFNNGLHGWGYTEEQYRDGLLRLMDTFKQHAAGAKLIWATTTPVRDRDNSQQIGERTERVKARNRIAAEIMEERGIRTNDLYGLVESHPEFFSGDGVHFNVKGKETQGAAVAECVMKCLGGTSRPSK
jgi:lysophospholipase L1-like esterase